MLMAALAPRAKMQRQISRNFSRVNPVRENFRVNPFRGYHFRASYAYPQGPLEENAEDPEALEKMKNSEFCPIASAPVRTGNAYGPCLLWPSATGTPRWVIGRWYGEGWCDDEGWVYAPKYFAPLPETPPAEQSGQRGVRAGR